MTRWNLSAIFFLGESGRRREITLKPDAMNIVTGASGTGKSALIKAIDYCLGSSKCELPVHVRRHCIAVGVKWVAGEQEMILGRLVPPDGQATSTHMFATAGRELPLPSTVADFDGATTVEAAKAFIERAFGIGDLADEPDAGESRRRHATVRHVTPYLFVTKEVIDSEAVLLHGLEKADKARDIVATMPYFLRATDESSAIDERRLRQLQHVLDKEEALLRSRAVAVTALRQRAISLLTEAHRIGIAVRPSPGASEDELLLELKKVSETKLEADVYPDEGELGTLHKQRRDILTEIAAARSRLQATRTALREATGFQGAVSRQRGKLMVAEHLNIDGVTGVCPVCEAPSERGIEAARALQAALAKVRAESIAVERVRPKLIEYEQNLEGETARLNRDLRRVDDQIQTWLRQTEETRRLADVGQLRAHLLGRVSFFLETSADEPRQSDRDLGVLQAEIAQLEARVNREARDIKLRRAEAKISQFASHAFAALPCVAPCIGADLHFSSRPLEVTVIEAGSGSVLRLPDIGSDQNYLAIHIALSFALQRYFSIVSAPVPGILVLDQISRPYFPARGENVDEKKISVHEEDEDIQALRKHIEFLFAEVDRMAGLQVLLIEHAYFADDPRYVAATRERWTRGSGRALIPLDWPMRRQR